MEWFKAVNVFESVVRSRLLSVAARKQGLLQASVSRHINDLENSPNVRVMNRTSRRLSLTEAGRTCSEKVENILHQISDAENAVLQRTAKPRGVLRIHARMLVGHLYVVPALRGIVAELLPEV